MKRITFLILLFLFVIPLHAQGPPLNLPGEQLEIDGSLWHITADWTISDADLSWLQKVYIPSRLDLAKRNYKFAFDENAPALTGYTIDLYLHRSWWTHDDIPIIGLLAEWPNVIYPYHFRIEISWPDEMDTGHQLILTHELGHVLCFAGFRNGWTDFGHSTKADPYLQKLLAVAGIAYIADFPYDPFKPGILAGIKP